MTTFRPHLACDVDLTKLKYPVIAFVKYDGVRMLNIGGQAVGRSLKAFRNHHTQRLFGGPEFAGLDGELLCSELDRLDPAQCRSTSSRTSAANGGSGLVWIVFDDLTNPEAAYLDRISKLRAKLTFLPSRVVLAHHRMVENEGELLAYEREVLDAGAEGLILRDPHGKHKNGRSTATGGYLRLKRWTDEEFRCVGLEEAQHNGNEATTNALGHTERSSHKANLSGKGMVGAILLEGGLKCGPGTLTHDERTAYWQAPETIVGKLVKVKHLGYGQKDALRMPTFLSLRDEEDMS